MITPNKHTDIRLSLLYIAGITLKQISSKGMIKYDDLKSDIVRNIGDDIGDLLEYSLAFLFMLNRISYDLKTDSFKAIL